MKKPLIVLTGPTAAGKTHLSIALAKAFTAFARAMDRWVFPAAVGPVRTISGFFIIAPYI